MSYLFSGGRGRQEPNYIRTPPFLFTSWVFLNSTGNQTIAGVFDNTLDDNYFELAILGGKVACRRRYVSLFDCQSSNAPTGTWFHAAAWMTAAGASVWFNGANRVNDANAIGIPPGLNRTSLGVLDRLSPGAQQLDGMLAHTALWMGWTPADLDAVVAALAAGRNPLAQAVQPFHYVDQTTNVGTANLTDYRAGLPSFAITGATFNASNPTVDAPSSGGGIKAQASQIVGGRISA